MARYQQKSTARSIRKDDEHIPDSMPAPHKRWVGVILDAAIHAGYGVYVSKWYASGKATIRFYVDDEAVETFISFRDDPGKWGADTAGSLFSDGLAKEVVTRGAAMERQAGAGSTKPVGA